MGGITIKKVYLVIICLSALFLYACQKQSSDSDIKVSKVSIDSIMYQKYENLLENTYGLEPYFSEENWIDSEGNLLYPYEDNSELMTGIGNILASLYMPKEVVKNASSEELLRIVLDGLLETNAVMPFAYNNPSDYVSYCCGINQAVNELLQRSDLVEVIYNDYCNRSYDMPDEYAKSYEFNKLQFEEIILGSNHAFTLMNDDMREDVLEEVIRKNAEIAVHANDIGLTSGFFAMIEDEYSHGNSEWYTYICDNNYSEAKNVINVEVPSWRN